MRLAIGFFQSRRGAAAIEFAIIAPVFFLLLMGVIAYGVYFSAAHAVQQISADAARSALAGIDDEERKTLVDQYVEAQAHNYAFIDVDRLQITVAVDETLDTELVVSVSYDASNLPIWTLWRNLPLPDQVIEKQAAIRLGGL
ncbi:MAG: TadE/TadG family type IV pilus assembly protein [Parvularculaceae bacterium]